MTAAAVIGFLINDLWYIWLLLLAAGCVLISVSITDRYEYECQKCHGKYRLGIKGVIASRHGRDAKGGWAISRCPHCRAVTKARESRSNGEEKG